VVMGDNLEEPVIEFTQGNLLDFNVADADVIFVHATCFDSALMKAMVNQLKVVREGTYVIVISKELDSPFFPVAFSGLYKMSWGQCRVYVHQKAPPPRKLNLDAHWTGNQRKLDKLLVARPKRRVIANLTNANLNITDTHPNEGVLLENCVDSTVTITGKVAAINIIKCTNTKIRVETVIATSEIIDCKNCTFAFEDCAMYHCHHVHGSTIEAVQRIVKQRPQGAGGWLCVTSECSDVRLLLKSAITDAKAVLQYTIPSSFSASSTRPSSDAGSASATVQQSGQIKTVYDVHTASFTSNELVRNKFGYIDWIGEASAAPAAAPPTVASSEIVLDVFHV